MLVRQCAPKAICLQPHTHNHKQSSGAVIIGVAIRANRFEPTANERVEPMSRAFRPEAHQPIYITIRTDLALLALSVLAFIHSL